MSDPSPSILITGGADGIGWASARAFAAAGWRVAIADLRGEAARARAAELGAGERGAAHLGLACDVAVEADVVAAVAAAGGRFGRLDALLNNAGIGTAQKPTLEQDVASFEQMVRIHLTGTFTASREAYRIMRGQGGGAIVNIASIVGLGGLPRRNAYGAAKAGIISLTRSMACEWAADGVRVNAVAPGYVETALVRNLRDAGALDTARLARRVPLGRLGRPEEIAAAILFLCSPAASYITGSTLAVDGGWTAFGDAGDASAPAGPAG